MPPRDLNAIGYNSHYFKFGSATLTIHATSSMFNGPSAATYVILGTFYLDDAHTKHFTVYCTQLFLTIF